MAIQEVVDWTVEPRLNEAVHPVGPRGRDASRTSLSFQELQGAIARWRDTIVGGLSPLTTKGDLFTFDTADVALPVGADGLVLTANSATATGLEWAAAAGGITATPTPAATEVGVWDSTGATIAGTNGDFVWDGPNGTLTIRDNTLPILKIESQSPTNQEVIQFWNSGGINAYIQHSSGAPSINNVQLTPALANRASEVRIGQQAGDFRGYVQIFAGGSNGAQALQAASFEGSVAIGSDEADFNYRIRASASTTTRAGIRLLPGVAPTSPVDGDFWPTAAGAANMRLNGVTVNLADSGVTAAAGANQEIQFNSSGAFGASSLLKWNGADLLLGSNVGIEWGDGDEAIIASNATTGSMVFRQNGQNRILFTGGGAGVISMPGGQVFIGATGDRGEVHLDSPGGQSPALNINILGAQQGLFGINVGDITMKSTLVAVDLKFLSGNVLAGTVDGNTQRWSFDGELALNAGYSEDADSYTVTVGTKDLDTSLATYFYAVSAMTAVAVDFTFSNPAATGRVTSFMLEMNNMVANTDATPWPTSVDWAGGTEPIWTAGIDVAAFWTRDGGTTWHGSAATLDSQ